MSKNLLTHLARVLDGLHLTGQQRVMGLLVMLTGLTFGTTICIWPQTPAYAPPPERKESSSPYLLQRPGDYATAYADDPISLAWATHFRTVEVGDVNDPPSSTLVTEMRAAGVERLLLYDWMPAGYHYTDGSPDNPLMDWFHTRRYTTTLNPDGPWPHCTESGYDWCQDEYYDLGNADVITHRVNYLLQQLRTSGYDGLFFDWGSGRYIEDPAYDTISATYTSRHPQHPYGAAVADFYRILHSAAPTFTLVTNQGFRRAEAVLPFVQADMSESYVTTDAIFSQTLYLEGQGLLTVPLTVYYPVSPDPFHGTLSDTLGWLGELADLSREYGGADFEGTIYLNYAAPEYQPTGEQIGGRPVYTTTVPRTAIYFGYAVPKLLGQMSYTEVPFDRRCERDEIYFYALGPALDDDYERIDGGYLRYYTYGLVLVGEWQEPVTLTLSSSDIPSQRAVYDAFEDHWLTTGQHTLTVTVQPRPDPLTGNMAPSGRLYFYGFTTRLMLPLILRAGL